MKTLGYALSLVVAALLAGSLLGGAASFVWLAILGEWSLLGLGLGMAVAVLVLAPLLLLPARLLASAAGSAPARARPLVVVAVLTNLYSALVLAASLLAFLLLLFHDVEVGHTLPAAVWSYAVATLPWLWLAYRQDRATEGAGGGAALLAVLGKAAYVVGLLSSHYADLGPVELGGAMLVVVGLGAVMNASGAARAPGEGAGTG